MSGTGTQAAANTARVAFSAATIRRIRRVLRRWGRDNYRDFPWRRSGAEWQRLIAEVLLQRTRASAVTPVYTELIERFPDPASLAAAGEEELASLFRPLGLAWRIPLLRQLASCLAERGGRVPLSFDELRTLPLVGDYVAAAYLSLHAGHRAVLIDANVVRWLCRLTGRPYGGETRRKLWLRELAESVTPRQQVREFNYALLDFTMDVCAVRPACNRCPLRRICEYGAG